VAEGSVVVIAKLVERVGIRSLRGKLLILFVLLALTPSLLIGVSAVLLTQQVGKAAAFDKLTAAAVLKKAEIRDWQEDLATTLRLIREMAPASSPLAQGAAGIAEHLRRAVRAHGQFHELMLLDTRGRVIASSDNARGAATFQDAQFFRSGLQHPGFHLESSVVNGDGYVKRGLVVVEPVRDSQGEVVGVLCGRTSLNRLNQIMLERSGLGETGETYIVAQDRMLLTESRFKGYEQNKTILDNKGVVIALSDMDDGQDVYPDYRDIMVMGVHLRLPDLDVVILSEQDQAEALHSVRTTMTTTALLTLMSMALAITVSIVFARSLTTPLSRLAGVAGKIARGELELRVELRRQDEIGVLAAAFNSMTDQLQRRIEIENLVSSLSRRSLAFSGAEIPEGVAANLTAVGEFLDVDRAMVSRFPSAERPSGQYWEWTGSQGEKGGGIVANSGRESLPDWLLSGLEQGNTVSASASQMSVSGLGAGLYTPLIGQGELLGLVGVEQRGGRQWSESDVRLLHLAGEILLNMLERWRYERELAAQSQINLEMANVSQSLLSSGSLEEISEMVVQAGRRLTSSALGFAKHIDPATDHLVSPTLTNEDWESRQLPGKQFISSEFIELCEEVLRNRASLLTNAPVTDERSSGPPVGHLPINNFLGAPSLIGDELLGIFALANTEHGYRPGDLEVVKRLTALYSLALQRKKTEQELARTRSYIRNIIDSMPSALIGVDREVRITHWNIEAARKTGVSAEGALRCQLTDMVPEMTRFIEDIRSTVQERKPRRLERMELRRGDRSVVEDVVVYPLITNGVEGAVIRVDDVTERVRIEEMMVQNEKMMTLGGLAAGIAHEINNPLGGISGAVQVLKSRLQPSDRNREAAQAFGLDADTLCGYFAERKVYKYLEEIQSMTARASGIIREVLNFSRRSVSSRALCEPSQLVSNALTWAANDYDIKKRYDFNNIDVTVEIEPDTPEIPCIETQIEQVLINLLKNAAQAMEHNDRKTKPPRIAVRVAKEPGFVRIEIQDNGCGMDEYARSHLFEPFFTTKEIGVGTGLGMSVSYYIVTQNHGGSFSVESTPREGSNIIIRLPYGEISI